MKLNLKGKVSWFGGPDDTGVKPDEGLAFISDVDQQPSLFLSYQPEGTTGLARRLNPETYYVATRWDYDQYPKSMLLEEMALIRAPKTGKQIKVYPADWGPHQDTNRVANVSPATLEYLGIQTDDEIELVFPFTQRSAAATKLYSSIVISSGHGKYVRGAAGVLDEVDEARRVVERVAQLLRNRDVEVKTFHDDTSHSQNENLNTIVNYHNKQSRDLNVSVHFNAYVETQGPMGTECLYVTQATLADHIAKAIAEIGFINRGAKKRTDLFFLNQTTMPSILIEVCFVDSSANADIYETEFDAICDGIVTVLGGQSKDDLKIAKVDKGEV